MQQFMQESRNKYYSYSNPTEVRFIKAAERNDFKTVKEIVKENIIYIDVKDEFGSTALALAGLHENLEMMHFLVTHNADLESQNHVGMTPLHYAASQNKLSSVKELVSLGADLTSVDGYKRTVLKAATGKGADLVVDYLINNLKIDVPEDIFAYTAHDGEYNSNTGNANRVVTILCNKLNLEERNENGHMTGFTIHLGVGNAMTLHKQKLWDQSGHNKERYERLLEDYNLESSDSESSDSETSYNVEELTDHAALINHIIRFNNVAPFYKIFNFFIGCNVINSFNYYNIGLILKDIYSVAKELRLGIKERIEGLGEGQSASSLPKLIELDQDGTIFNHAISFYGGFVAGKFVAKPFLEYINDAIVHSNEDKSFISYFEIDIKDVVQTSVSMLTYNFMPNTCSIAEKIIASKVISDTSVGDGSFTIGYSFEVLEQVAVSYVAFATIIYTGQAHLLEKNSAVVGLVVTTAPDLSKLIYISAEVVASTASEYAAFACDAVTEMYNHYLVGMDSTTEDAGL